MITTILACSTCRFTADEKLSPDGRSGGEILAAEIEQRATGIDGVRVRRHSCLMGCESHCNTAVLGAGKLTYVLGKFEPGAEAAEAVIDYAELHRDSETGRVPFKQWPQGVKGHFVARIPVID